MKRISMTYGQVLFELGIKKESLQKAQDMLHENEELLSALENPTITKKENENVVEKLYVIMMISLVLTRQLSIMMN